jgi:hypothetical protein
MKGHRSRDRVSSRVSSRVGSEVSSFEMPARRDMSSGTEKLNGVESSELAVAE